MYKTIFLLSSLPPPMGGISAWTKNYLNYFDSIKIPINFINTSLFGKNINNHEKRNMVDEIKRTLSIRNQLKKYQKVDINTVVHYNTSCSLYGMLRDLLFVFPLIDKGIIVTQCHCDLSNAINGKIKLRLLKSLLKKSKVVLVLNESSQIFLRENSINNGRYLPNFISTEEINNIRENKISRLKNIAFVGHVRVEKGINDIIACAKMYPNMQFHVFGQLPQKDHFERLVNVIYYGNIEKRLLFEKLLRMDCFLFLSHSEGFPLSILEAMYLGLPIISNRVGAVQQILSNTRNILCDIGNLSQVYEAIDYFNSIVFELDEIGKENMKIVRDHYDAKTVLNSLLKLYEVL